MATHSSVLAWRILGTGEPGGLPSVGSHRVGHTEATQQQQQQQLVASVSHSVVSNSLQPHGLQSTRLLCPWNSPGKNTGLGSHTLLQKIFPTQGLNLGLLRCQQILYHLSHQGSLYKRLCRCNTKDKVQFFMSRLCKCKYGSCGSLVIQILFKYQLLIFQQTLETVQMLL